MPDDLTARLAERLKTLRQDKGWSLDALAKNSGVSRATLSRLENEEVSPTTEVLAKLCRAYEMSLTRLLSLVEHQFTPLVKKEDQQVWTDAEKGFTRRAISPPATSLASEMLLCELQAGKSIEYDGPPVYGQEHHLYLQKGALTLTLSDTSYSLKNGDCLRYRLFGPSRFENTGKAVAQYILTLTGA